MELKRLVKILKEKNNCYISDGTYKSIKKEEIEKECGFEVEIKRTTNCDNNGYVVIKKI